MSHLKLLQGATRTQQRWTSGRTLFPLARRRHPAPSPLHYTTPAPSCRRRFSATAIQRSGDQEETFEEFTTRFEKEFEGVNDVFELQRNLNNAFAYDLVPAPSVIVAALRAARRVNDFPTAVRIFEGIKAKVENKQQYDEYVQELESLREELGVPLKESLYPEADS